jgi:folate-dependent phosphoribosylglycinamide formyltransferase PurN
VLLTGDHGNQRALAHKMANVCDLRAVVVSQNIPRKKSPDTRRIFLNRVAGRLVGRPFVRSWSAMQRRYDGLYPRFPEVARIDVRNVNDDETLRALDEHAPDVVLVSGTNLVGRRIIEWASSRKGVLNLHTGISPYVKGGPNCTNWCLADRMLHLIGSTVMYLDLGIDTGAIIGTERTQLTGRESLTELHVAVMDHGQDMYVRAVRALAAGKTLSRVPQSAICEGRTYFTREWNAAAMLRASINFRRDYRPATFQSEELRARAAALELVTIPT